MRVQILVSFGCPSVGELVNGPTSSTLYLESSHLFPFIFTREMPTGGVGGGNENPIWKSPGRALKSHRLHFCCSEHPLMDVLPTGWGYAERRQKQQSQRRNQRPCLQWALTYFKLCAQPWRLNSELLQCFQWESFFLAREEHSSWTNSFCLIWGQMVFVTS